MKDSGVEWIGEIPQEWGLFPARCAFSEVKEKNSDGKVQKALQFKFGTIIPKSNFDADGDDYVSDTITNYTIVDVGTVMINGLNLNYDFKSLRVGLVREQGVITSAYLALSPNHCLITSEFATYLFKGYEAKMAFHNMGAGIRKTLGFKEFKNQPILLPTLDEQQKIADYLDQQCVAIDAMLDKTRASIEEYKKLKQSVITEAVTRGIDFDVGTKDSGLNWMGRIPSAWRMIRLKFLMKEIVDCPHETPVYSADGTYFVIRTADQDYARLRCDDDMYRLDESEYRNRIRRLPLNKGDIVYGREGERWGLACLIPQSNKYCLGQRIMQFRCNQDIIIPEFAMYALTSAFVRRQGELDTIGSTSPHVNISTICNYRIPTPLIGEQNKIVAYLDQKCSDIDALIAKKTQFLTELENYKKSLIYEYVTGKKEVLW
jgi:type I restriction enzyme S subunit